MQGLPAPPPSIAYDVNEFRKFFKFGLDQLKYNNKYIINDLTTLASVYHHRMSTYIVKDIEQHIRNSHPSHRLIGFYVLDSICKNLGHPFPQLFKPFIERLFLIAYRDIEDIDPITKVKFEELLGTWRTGSATQTELFDPDIQRRIEEGIFGSWRRPNESIASQAFLNGIKQQPAIATPAEKASILYDVRRILAEREQVAAAYPGDHANLAQMATLQQLDQLIASQQLTISQVDDIRKQLQPLKASILPPPAVECGILPSQMHAVPPQMAPLLTPPIHQPQHPGDCDALASLTKLLETNPELLLQAVKPPPPVLPQPPLTHQHQPPLNFDVANQALLDAVSQISHPPVVSSVPHPAPTLANANMFDSQQLAAALAYLNPPISNSLPTDLSSHDRSIELHPQPSPAPSTLSTSESTSVIHPDPVIMEYENLVAALPIELHSASINRVKAADIADILYSHIPQFCRQDGSRFLYGKTGSQRASEQLDRHFRLHRRVRESGQRAQQRMWAQTENEWLESHDFGSPDGDESDAGRRKKRKSVEEEKSVSELSKKSVVRPSSPGLASQPCPICQESFETRFDEEEDEFYWLNAIELIREAGKRSVYHATCHYETIRNKARMRIKTELEENRLKMIQQAAERNIRVDGGRVTKDPNGVGLLNHTLNGNDGHSEVGSSCSDNVKRPLGSTGGKCLLQVDETFFGETETAPKIKLESSSSSVSNSSLKQLSVAKDVKDDHQTEKDFDEEKPNLAHYSVGDLSACSLLGKRKSSPIEEEDHHLGPTAAKNHSGCKTFEDNSKKSKLS